MPDPSDAAFSALVPVPPGEVVSARPVGRPTKRTPELTAELADYMARGLTDEEAAALAGIDADTLTEWNKVPEFSGAVKAAKARRTLERLERIERGEQGWQGTAWAMERLHPKRFARPEVLIQNNVMAAASADAQSLGVMTDGQIVEAQRQRERALLADAGERNPVAISPERLARIQALRRVALDVQPAHPTVDAGTLAVIQRAEKEARGYGERT